MSHSISFHSKQYIPLPSPFGEGLGVRLLLFLLSFLPTLYLSAQSFRKESSARPELSASN